MIDAFDAAFDNAPQPQPQAQPPRTYDAVPPGVHDAEIVRAERKPVAWRASDDNPTGDCLVLRLSAGSAYGFVFVDLPLDRRWMLEHLGRAINATVDADNPSELIGKRARVEIKNYTARSGQVKASVAKWVPAKQEALNAASEAARPKQERPKANPIRTQSPRSPSTGGSTAAPARFDDDDIPF